MTKKALIVSASYDKKSQLPGREYNIGMMLNICTMYDIPGEEVVVLYTPKETTVASILDNWTKLRNGCLSNDVLLFYFHGHGYNGLVCCSDKHFDPSKLTLPANDFTHVTIFDCCYAGVTTSTGIHSIQGASLYIASSNLATVSNATKKGSLFFWEEPKPGLQTLM